MTKESCLAELSKYHSDFRGVIGQLVNFKSHLPNYIKVYEKSAQKEISELKRRLNSDLDIPFVKSMILNDLDKRIKNLPEIIYPMTLIYAVTHFEVFLSNVTSLLLTYYWKSLKTKSKTLSYEEILSNNSIDDLKNLIIKKEVEKLAFGSIRERIIFLEQNFKFKFENNKEKINSINPIIFLTELIEIHSTRNIIIHNNSIVNEFYLKDNLESKYKIGDKINIDKNYTFKSLYNLSKTVQAISQVSENKIKL